ncbi:MAG: AzlD domain-containing protein [Anaerolineales bacterium]|nr:AzlD domain-containing protein [Anaerolineales bacterium]
MNIWLVFLLGGLLTYATRLSMIFLLGRIEIPEQLQRALRFVPPAVLTALIIPELVMPSGALMISLENFRLIAGIAAVLAAWWSRNTIITILAGMAALVLLNWLL